MCALSRLNATFLLFVMIRSNGGKIVYLKAYTTTMSVIHIVNVKQSLFVQGC